MKQVSIEVNWPGREQIQLDARIEDSGELTFARLIGVGSNLLIEKLIQYRKILSGPISDIVTPTGNLPEDIALREVILKLKNEWVEPYPNEEVCHCRAVSTQRVDLAICTGAHSLKQIREQTSANTACGTCIDDIKAMLKCRLR